LVSVAVLVILCAMAGTAAASTAQVVDVVLPPYCKYNPPGGAGEANVVSLTGTRAEIQIVDRAAVIEPGPGCSSIGPHNVRCSEPEVGLERVFVTTAGGADTVRSGPAPLTAGFPGEFIVDGGQGSDLLVGGPGADDLYAGKAEADYEPR
jgi:hypothetical protein